METIDDEFLADIERAKSVERLEFLASVIRDDSEAGESYTKNTEYMQQLRNAWTARKMAIRAATNE